MTKLKNLKQILVSDKHFVPSEIKNIMTSEVFKCLQNYLEIEPENIKSDFDIDENGDFRFDVTVTTKRIKILGILPNEV